MNCVFFDLEGPLSPEDNAYNLMKLFSYGDKIFEVISRYDDILTLEGKENYEPGDTLALIAPFLLYHEINEQDIINLAHKASITSGAQELIGYLNRTEWQVYCISTSYHQYAYYITQRIGIASENVASTYFPINRLTSKLKKSDFNKVAELEKKIIDIEIVNDAWIKNNLDNFYWTELPKTNLGFIFNEIKPIGGNRKVEALMSFLRRVNKPLSECIAIGDSITDFKMLKIVNESGGLAIAFNGNEYVLPYATIGLASLNIFDLCPVFNIWKDDGRLGIERWIKKLEIKQPGKTTGNFKWLVGETNLSDYLEIHKKMRSLVRQDAAKLG